MKYYKSISRKAKAMHINSSMRIYGLDLYQSQIIKIFKAYIITEDFDSTMNRQHFFPYFAFTFQAQTVLIIDH